MGSRSGKEDIAKILKLPPRDFQIPFKVLRVLQPNGEVSDPQRLEDVLAEMDRSKTLVLYRKPNMRRKRSRSRGSAAARYMAEVEREEEEEEDEDEGDQYAVCRFENKEAVLRAREEAIKAYKAAEKMRKELEINWATADHDLQVKLRKLREFLTKGKRVDVMLAPKRSGKKATEEEAAVTLEKLRAVAKELAAKESHVQGGHPGMMRMQFEVPKPEKEE